jgi:shikimate kinase
MMGSGKTTVGKATAARLGWPFVDSDAQVEARVGRTVEEIWERDGEAAFRHLETEALADALALTERRPAVVAAAGGVVLDPRNRALLNRYPRVVWLRADLDTLAERVGTGAGRPLLDEDPRAVLERLMAVRHPLYEEVAGHVVDVDHLALDEVVERVLKAAAPQ